MLWLDHLLFGNGHGLKSPYFDSVFYWLSGRLYTFHGWYGAQLQSFEWRIPRPGTRRRLLNREFVVFQARRKWLRVRVSWAWVDLPKPSDEANIALNDMRRELSQL